jgi:hypothetical protein
MNKLMGEKMNDSITPAKYIFITDDCMGNKVGLKPETFSLKILRDHPDMTPDIIKESVECAHIVAKDPDPHRFKYYKIIPNPAQGRDDVTNIKVVIETSNSTECGEVVTAFLLRHLRNEISKGDIIYDAGSASMRGIRF